MHILHWGSCKALWNVGLLIRGQSLLYCVYNLKMAVCCGQSMDSLHPESAGSSLRVVQMCTPPLSHPHQVQGVTQSPCWLSLLCWHWPAHLEVKVCIFTLNLLTVCVSICLSINYHCCTPHTLCNMIYIGHPLTYRSFMNALVSRPKPNVQYVHIRI